LTRIGKRPSEKHQLQSGNVFQTALLVRKRWLDANLLWFELQAGQGGEIQDCSNSEGVDEGGAL